MTLLLAEQRYWRMTQAFFFSWKYKSRSETLLVSSYPRVQQPSQHMPPKTYTITQQVCQSLEQPNSARRTSPSPAGKEDPKAGGL